MHVAVGLFDPSQGFCDRRALYSRCSDPEDYRWGPHVSFAALLSNQDERGRL